MKLSRLLTLLFVLFAVAGCSSFLQEDTAPSSDPLGLLSFEPDEPAVIVILAPEEATYAQLRDEVITSVEMAVTSGTRAEDLDIVVEVAEAACDISEYDLGRIMAGYPNTVGVIGPLCEEMCITASLALNDIGLTAISPSCHTTTLTDPLLHSAAFLRTIYANDLASQTAANFAFDELGARRAIVVADTSLSAQDAISIFSTQWQDKGGILAGSITWTEETPAPEVMASVADARPNIVYAHLDENLLVEFIREYTGSGANQQYQLIVSGNVQTNWVTNRLGGSLLTNIYTIAPFSNTATYAAFAQRFSSNSEAMPTPYGAAAYDATLMLLEAVDQSVFRRADGSYVMGKTTLRDHLYETAGFEGVTGRITCTSWGNCGAPNIGVFQYVANEWDVTYVP